jgi:hypothetical protein
VEERPDEEVRMTVRPARPLLLLALVAALGFAACAAPAQPAAPPSAAPAGPGPGAPASPAPEDGTTAFPYQALWPFADAEQAREWQTRAAPQGHQPWHVDAEFTALAFTQGFLGFTEIDEVTSTDVEGDEAWIGVGSALPDGGRSTAAVVHLVRFGSGPDAPWEVVGTRDDTLVLDTPRYGDSVSSPVTAGGTITGVDESLRLQVRQVDRDGVLGEYCCTPAGGTDQRWTAQVPFEGTGTGALTLVVSTGGHVADVERFAVTGLRVRGT